MYAKGNNTVTYFVDTFNEGRNTDKVFYGRISEAIKTGQKNEEGKDVYKFEGWNVRFVGKAREKINGMIDKSRIVLTEWAARVDYNKEKKQSYPYLLVMDFELPVLTEQDVPEVVDDPTLPF